MANMASVSYRIEGPKDTLEKINNVIVEALSDRHHWTEAKTLMLLGFTDEELDGKRIGGEIDDEPSITDNTLEFYAEERWGLQDFEWLLRQKFPEIKVYWIVEEPGCRVYATNDKEGKYFPERFYVELAVDGDYYYEYFSNEDGMYKWLSDKTNGQIKSKEDVESYNKDFIENSEDAKNYVLIDAFEVVDN